VISGLTNLQKIRSLRWIAASSVMNTVFCAITVFGSVFILFLSELGLDKSRIGFLISLLPFCGLLALLTARFVERIGYKRIFLIFWGARKIILIPMLFTPAILENWGIDAAFAWITGIILLFGICRAVAESASYPWDQEIIPSYIRSRFEALVYILAMTANILTMLAASYVMSLSTDLNRFRILIAVGIAFGLVAVALRFWVPGGTREPAERSKSADSRGLLQTLRDRNYVLFLAGFGIATLANAGLVSFVPLFLKEAIGLAAATVVLVGIGTSVGMLLSCYVWGWAADRYGGKPVMLSGIYLLLLVPICYFLVPRYGAWSSYFAMGVAFLGGLGTMGWAIGYNRYLFVSAVPMDRRSSYLTIFYAWLGLVGGCGPLLAGYLISASSGINTKLLAFTLDGYSSLFAACTGLLIISLLLASRVHPDGAVPLGKFAGMFLQGNTLMAFGTLIKHRLTGDETNRAYSTELMGVARNPLTAVELVEVLNDPSFNVRYQAILSSARIPPDPDLIQALVEILESSQADLSIAAAWALGNIGDKTAVPPLRRAARSEYTLLQARAVRALASLGDVEEIPYLIERLRSETDEALRIAYASALGRLRCTEVLGDMADLLRNATGKIQRTELAWALAHMVGDERYYVRLWRKVSMDLGTTVAQVLLDIKKDLIKLCRPDVVVDDTVNSCVGSFAKEDFEGGTPLLAGLIDSLPTNKLDEISTKLLGECAGCLKEFGPARVEYIVLALHTITTVLKSL
jgi:Na+/melibiose symporter-like transporter